MAARTAGTVAGSSRPTRTRAADVPTGARLVATALLAAGALAILATPARADTVGRGPGGQRLTVSKTTGLERGGETVTVSGSGYDTGKGVYVAFCVDNGAGQLPSPCGGGIDTSGSSGASHWISANPPSYGEGLAVPYGPGGTFRVRLKVSATIGQDVDCTIRRCAVVTRNDHTRTADRSQDVRVPVSFAKPTAPKPAKTTAGAPAPPRTAGRPATPGAATAPTGGAGATPGAAVRPSATAAGGAPPPSGTASAGQPFEVARVSDSTAAGRLWTGSTALLGAALVVLLGLRLRARRRARR